MIYMCLVDTFLTICVAAILADMAWDLGGLDNDE